MLHASSWFLNEAKSFVFTCKVSCNYSSPWCKYSSNQNNVCHSCSVIWSAVGVVCLSLSSGVDKVYSSQYFDSLIPYSSLGCFEMLSSGRSIFHCSWWGRVEELNVLMQLLIGDGVLFLSFNRCPEACFEWFCGFRCCLHFSIALLENCNDVEIFGGRSLCLSIAMDLK